MRFVLNTNYQSSAGRSVLKGLEDRLLASSHSIVYNDWDNYSNYDVAIFMAPDSKIREAKVKDKNIFCVLFDPKVTLPRQREETKSADMLIVSSIEQRDALLKYNKNIFIYYMFADMPYMKKEHTPKEKIIIGYNGNKQHLDAMRTVSLALDSLALKYDIELWAIYNFKKLGKWKRNLPKVCSVRHIQWEKESFFNELNKCDIGISPSILNTPPPSLLRPISSFFYNPEGYHNNDYVVRFKFSNNPGRIYVFSQLGLPVVADFTPSSCQIIEDGKTGLLAGTKEGWEHALEKLILDHTLRQKLADSLKEYIDKEHSIDSNFKKFMAFLEKVKKR